MLKALKKDALVYTIPVIISRGMAIFLLPVYTRIASSSELGALDLFLAFGNIVAFTVALEISQGVARFIPEISDSETRKIYGSTGLIFTFLTYLAFIFTCMIFSASLSFAITGSMDFEPEFRLALIYIFLNGLFYYTQNLLRFVGKSAAFAFASVTYAVLNLGLTLYLGGILGWGLSAIFVAFIGSTVTALILTIFYLRDSLKLTFQLKALKKLLRFSLPLVPASVLVFLCLYIDRLMVSRLISLEASGLYSVGIRLASASSLIMMGFQMALTPLVYKHYKEASTRDALAKIFRYFVLLALLFFIIYSLVISEVLSVFTTEKYHGLIHIIPLLIMAFCFSQMYVFMPGITIEKKTILILFINFGIAFINVLLNLTLIPYFGLSGAAAATCASAVVGFMGHSYLSQKFYHVQHDWRLYVINLLFACFLIFMYFFYFSSNQIYVSVAVRLSIVIMFLVFARWTSLIHLQDAVQIKNFLIKKAKG